MEQRVLLEINRINQLMGVMTINESIPRFSRVGVKEAIYILKNNVDELVAMARKGHMNIDELKDKLTKNLDEFKDYLPPEIYIKFKNSLDELLNANKELKTAKNLANDLKTQLDELQTTIDNFELVKRNIDIDLIAFEKRVRQRFIDWLDNYVKNQGRENLLNGTTRSLDGPNPFQNKNGTLGDELIDRFKNPEQLDEFLDMTIDEHDADIKQKINLDKKLTDESKGKLNDLMESTANVRKEKLKEKIRENPNYKKKYSVGDEHYDAEYRRILNKKKDTRTGSEQKYLEEYHNYKYGNATKSMTEDELKSYMKNINDLYENSRKSNSIEYKVKTGSKVLGIKTPGLLRLLGTEWMQYLKMLVESLFGLRKTTDDWAREAEKSAAIIADEIDQLQIHSEADLMEYKVSIGNKIKQLKNEMQMSVSDWTKKYGVDFNARWEEMKVKMREVAKKTENQETIDMVEKIITKCEERNFEGKIITWKQNGFGGWKSIGDILDLTKRELDESTAGHSKEVYANKSFSTRIGETLTKMRDYGIALLKELNELRKGTGIQEAIEYYRKLPKSKNTGFMRLLDNTHDFIKTVLIGCRRIWLRKLFTGQFINFDVIIAKISSRGISRNPGTIIPQSLTRLTTLTILISVYDYFLTPVFDFIQDILGWIAEPIIESIPILRSILSIGDDQPVELVGSLGEEGQNILNSFKHPEVILLNNFTSKFSIDPAQAKILFFNFTEGYDIINEYVVKNKNQLIEEANKRNKEFNDEYTKIVEKMDKDYTNANPKQKKTMQENSVGKAFVQMTNMKTKIQKNAFIKQRMKGSSKYNVVCSDFNIQKFDYVINNVKYQSGPSPLLLQALIKSQNENTGTKIKDIVDKYKEDPELAATQIANLTNNAKRMANNETSSELGVIALLKGKDNKDYSIFTGSDGNLLYYTPSYSEIKKTLDDQDWVVENNKVVLNGSGENFNMERKHICEFPFP